MAHADILTVGRFCGCKLGFDRHCVAYGWLPLNAQVHVVKLTQLPLPASAQDRDGRSRGCGVVEFEHASDALRAISTLSNTTLGGRQIHVREDREEPGQRGPPPPRYDDRDRAPRGGGGGSAAVSGAALARAWPAQLALLARCLPACLPTCLAGAWALPAECQRSPLRPCSPAPKSWCTACPTSSAGRT